MPRIPTDPYDPYRPASEYDADREARLEREGQFDPELAEGRPSTSRIVLLALAVALVLGAVFYSLNNSSVHQASTTSPAQTAQTKPASPNSQPDMTTGSATKRPTLPQSSSTGSELDHADNPNSGQNNDNR
jgi:uncharacterized protein HemX